MDLNYSTHNEIMEGTKPYSLNDLMDILKQLKGKQITFYLKGCGNRDLKLIAEVIL